MPDRNVSDWRETLKPRLLVALCVLVAWAVGIEARLLYLQVVDHDELARRADSQQQSTRDLPAKRGEIQDRRGRVLAYSVDAETVYVVPTQVGDPEQAAGTLCRALDGDDCSRAERTALAARIRRGQQEGRYFAYVRRQVSPQQAKRIVALEMEGVGFVPDSRRYYPNRELASQLLGYVGIDGDGLGGIESTYDSLIKGRPGSVLVQVDARGQAFSRVERPATAGATIELTIDSHLQFIVERELRRGVLENRARAGSAVVMDPATGEILAMASWPTFNPNVQGTASDAERRNRAVQDLYEPGSIFKIVTAAAALEQNLVRPDDLIDARGGRIRVASSTFTDTHDYGVLSFTDAIVKSSNVGAIRVGLRLGADRLLSYVDRFGFGRQLSPDFPGENPGIVRPASRLREMDLASISMGYTVGVTPLQMAAAVSAVANGGRLMQPRVVRAVVRDGRRAPVPHKTLGESVEGTVAAEVTRIMEEVVTRGTGTPGLITGYSVAGKTGTAIKLVNGSYRGHSEYNASFVGFVPSRSPTFTVVVAIDSPHGSHGYYGGPVAGPVFQRIADEALRYYGVPRTIDPPEPVFASRRDRGSAITPAPIVSVVAVAPSPSGQSLPGYPDVRGLGAREAVARLSQAGYTADPRGSGVVSDQWPVPGTPVEPGARVSLRLERRLPVAAESGTGES